MFIKQKLLVALILTGASATTLAATEASAQNNVKIENRQFGALQLNVEKGALEASPTLNGWWSADWQFERISGSSSYRIKNRFTGVYLNTETTPVQATDVPPNYATSYWELEPTTDGYYRMKNPFRGTYLNAQTGRLDATKDANSLGAQWKLIGLNGPETVKQCVKNVFGTGILARVKWYNPDVVTYVPGDPQGDNANTTDVDEALPTLKLGADGRAMPVKNDTIALGQESCITVTRPAQRPHFAMVSVEGGKYATAAVNIGLTTGIALAGIAACAPTFGAGCGAAAAAIVSLTAGGTSIGTVGLPDAKETFYVGVPGQLEVKGTVFAPVSNDVAAIDSRSSLVRQRDATDAIKAAFVGEDIAKDQRGIRFFNQAGYAASLSVGYFVFKNVGGQTVASPAFAGTETITAGFERTIVIPKDIVPGTPVTVSITGVATVKNSVFSVVLPGDFTGEKCFKAYGSLFNPEGGTC